MIGYRNGQQTFNGIENSTYVKHIKENGEETTVAQELIRQNSSLSEKQDNLVSGTNIKTINGNSILGSGNIEIQGGGGSVIKNHKFEKVANTVNTTRVSGSFAYMGMATRIKNIHPQMVKTVITPASDGTVDICLWKDNGELIINVTKNVIGNVDNNVSVVFPNYTCDDENIYIGFKANSKCKFYGNDTINSVNTSIVTADNVNALSNRYCSVDLSINNLSAWGKVSETTESRKVSYSFQFGIFEKTEVVEKHKMNYLYVDNSFSSADRGFGVDIFNSIYEANESITNNSAVNPYTIIVSKGTYTDLQTRYYGVGHTGTYQGVICKNYVYYESENINEPQDTIISWDGAVGLTNPTRNDIFDKCPFHIGTSNCHTHIKGFTFSVKNARYSFHSESAGKGGEIEWEVADCIFDWGGCPNCTDDDGKTQAIGCGVTPNEKGKYYNCKIISATGCGYLAHDGRINTTISGTKAFINGARISFVDCDFGNSTIELQSAYPRDTEFSAQNNNIFKLDNCIGITKLYGYQSRTTNPSGEVTWRIKNEASEIADNKMSDYTF